uniref:Uncharacterized protein n=1 Tax=Anguilla anguilla TaxID=7936 RepID=A0A0E9TJV5_ANGAN
MFQIRQSSGFYFYPANWVILLPENTPQDVSLCFSDL